DKPTPGPTKLLGRALHNARTVLGDLPNPTVSGYPAGRIAPLARPEHVRIHERNRGREHEAGCRDNGAEWSSQECAHDRDQASDDPRVARDAVRTRPYVFARQCPWRADPEDEIRSHEREQIAEQNEQDAQADHDRRDEVDIPSECAADGE